MSSTNSITYASVQSFAFGAVGFASSYLAQPLLKTAITRLALGAIGASILGGAIAIQYTARHLCKAHHVDLVGIFHYQSIAIELYNIAICTTFVALEAISIPQALITLSLLSLYPLLLSSLVYLLYNKKKSSVDPDVLARLNMTAYLPKSPLAFPIGEDLSLLVRGLCSLYTPEAEE